MKKFNLHFEPAFPRAEEEILEIFKDATDKSWVKKGLLQAILDNLPFNIMVLNDTSTITYVNSHFCQLIGYTREELIDLTLSEFAQLLVSESEYDFTRYPRILAGETIVNYSYTFRHKKNYNLKVKYNSYPLRINPNEKPIGCLCIIEPIENC
ncbi:MAG: PAS domain-containing protein [Bacillota bacterium]